MKRKGLTGLQDAEWSLAIGLPEVALADSQLPGKECKPFGVSEAPRTTTRGICGKAKRNCAEATRLRPAGYVAVASRYSSPCFRAGIVAKASDAEPAVHGARLRLWVLSHTLRAACWSLPAVLFLVRLGLTREIPFSLPVSLKSPFSTPKMPF